MKKWLIAIFAFVISMNAFANEREEKLKVIFEKDILNAADSNMHMDKFAEGVLKYDPSFTKQELIAKFKEFAVTKEGQELFFPLYEEILTEESLDKYHGFLDDPNFLQYREDMAKAHKRVLKRALRIMNQIVCGPHVLEGLDQEEKSLGFIELTSSNVKEVLSQKRFCVIDVYTDWCGPCKAFSKVFKEAHQEMGELYTFAKLDAEKEADLSKEFHITGFPTILFFVDGKEVGRQLGYMNKQQFQDAIKKYFK